MTPRYILGISAGGESGAALFEHGRLVRAVNEERLSRKKMDTDFPLRSIDWCLRSAGLTAADIGRIAYGFSAVQPDGPLFPELFLRLKDYVADAEAMAVILDRLRSEHEVDHGKRQEFFQRTGALFPGVPIHLCPHHDAHRAAAFRTSPFSRALIVTADGRGDYKSLTLSQGERGQAFRELSCAYSWESLGYFYGRMTALAGFTGNRHEGKLTGLAAHGDPQVARDLVERMITLEDNRLRSFPGTWYRPFFSNFSPELLAAAARYRREDLAAAAQWWLERLVTQPLAHWVEQTGVRDICLAGGVFANIKLNQRIRELPGVDNVFVYPNMGDAGICAGAVYDLLGDAAESGPLPHLYLGPVLDPVALAEGLRSRGVAVRQPPDPFAEAVLVLQQGALVGLVQGAGEFGPRALGHRSILASPAYPAIGDTINRRLHRDGFMPLAPVIGAELAAACLRGYREEHLSARHMTMCYDATEALAESAAAIVHVDGTVRPQVVFSRDEPVLHALLARWHGQTGGLALINTSYNMHEEPIVNDHLDVLHAFDQGAVDYLLFPPYFAG
ncbi:MAG: hypothetical protein BWK76_05535 [Desulfobulbaceae bacterium A2]|nr:MAG: hypothetical protein BWK76_05535 [Desulfobulbaceae bacterium A2]